MRCVCGMNLNCVLVIECYDGCVECVYDEVGVVEWECVVD